MGLKNKNKKITKTCFAYCSGSKTHDMIDANVGSFLDMEKRKREKDATEIAERLATSLRRSL